jgi:hypothetical protein
VGGVAGAGVEAEADAVGESGIEFGSLGYADCCDD